MPSAVGRNAVARLQRHVLELLTEAQHAKALLPRLLEVITRDLGFDDGTLWTTGDEPVGPTESWRVAPAKRARSESRDEAIESKRRRCVATVWAQGGASWSDDVPDDVPCLCGEPSAASDLSNGLWLPIRSGDRCFGVLELSRRKPCTRDQDLLDTCSTLGRAVGRYLALDTCTAEHASVEVTLTARTAELETSRHALADSELQLRALARRLLGVREEKRAHLAREIHDVLGQELTGLKLDAAWLMRRVEERQEELVEPVLARLRTMVGAVDHMIGTVRRIATDLRPSVLDDLGLPAAIEWYGLDFGRRSGLEIALELPDELKLEPELSTALFRIVQELFTNVARHAHATAITLTLRSSGNALELRVRDDGVGIVASAAMQAESLGLAGIRERALAFQGTFAIGAFGGSGTEAIVRIPPVAPGAA